MTDYRAKVRISPPNSYVNAYGPGDLVTEEVVANWGLVRGEDVEPVDDYKPPRPAETSTDRAAWEAFVTGQGTTLEDARAASLAELRDMYDAPEPEPTPAWQVNDGMTANATPVSSDNVPTPAATHTDGPGTGDTQPSPERPPTSAAKADWVDYVIGAGGNEEWARAKDTTKDDLMAWEPGRNA
jgi:hypothetical protein